MWHESHTIETPSWSETHTTCGQVSLTPPPFTRLSERYSKSADRPRWMQAMALATARTRLASPTRGVTWRLGGAQLPHRDHPAGPREVWRCQLPKIGRRPVVVLSRDAAIPRLGRALAAPCTTTVRGISSQVVLKPGSDPDSPPFGSQSRLRRKRLSPRVNRPTRPASIRPDAHNLQRPCDRGRLLRPILRP